MDIQTLLTHGQVYKIYLQLFSVAEVFKYFSVSISVSVLYLLLSLSFVSVI